MRVRLQGWSGTPPAAPTGGLEGQRAEAGGACAPGMDSAPLVSWTTKPSWDFTQIYKETNTQGRLGTCPRFALRSKLSLDSEQQTMDTFDLVSPEVKIAEQTLLT